MRYYISDLHFYHSRLNDHMDMRGFESGEAMNEYMIEKWNSRVKPRDEVVILGDFCISCKAEEASTILKRLEGRKFLITGNHDRFLHKKDFDTSQFGWILPYKEMNDGGNKVILSHYPIMCYEGQYRRNKKGAPMTYMLYGHVHNTYDEFLVDEYRKHAASQQRMVRGSDEPVNIPCQMINCFCMFSDYVPLTLAEWIQVDRERRSKLQRSDFQDILPEEDSES